MAPFFVWQLACEYSYIMYVHSVYFYNTENFKIKEGGVLEHKTDRYSRSQAPQDNWGSTIDEEQFFFVWQRTQVWLCASQKSCVPLEWPAACPGINGRIDKGGNVWVHNHKHTHTHTTLHLRVDVQTSWYHVMEGLWKNIITFNAHS